MKGKAAARARAAGQKIEATVFMGRAGVSDGLATEVRDQLKSRRLIKVKLSKDACQEKGREAVAADLAARAEADLVEVRGFTALLATRRPNREPRERRPPGHGGAAKSR